MKIALLSTFGLHPYLTIERVESSLDVSKFQSCTHLEDGLYSIRFSLNQSGEATLLSGDECFSTIRDIDFPKNPNTSNIFVWDVIQKSKIIFSHVLRKEDPVQMFPGIFANNKNLLMDRDTESDE